MSIFATGLPKMRSKVVPVFITINNEYAPYAAAAVHALEMRSDKRRYYRVIILHDGLSLPNRVRLRSLATKNVAIQFKKISSNLYLKAIVAYCARQRRGTADWFAKAVYYYRAFIPRLFPQYEKAIYIDSDAICLGDIGELFDIDLGDKVVAAVRDPKITNVPEFRRYAEDALGVPKEQYVNSGVQLMDLRKLRKMKYLSTLIDLMKEYDADLLAPDQDYLNLILKGQIMYIDAVWNQEPSEPLPEGTRIVHYNLFNKPWHYAKVPCEKHFWNAVRGTGFYGDLKRQQEAFTPEKQQAERDKVAALVKKADKLAKAKKLLIKM